MNEAASIAGQPSAGSLPTWSSKLQGYVPGLTALVLAIALHFVFSSTIGIGPAGVFFLYLMAILLASWCGAGPGLVVLILSVALIPFAYRPNFRIEKIDPIGFAVLVLVSVITSQTSSARRRTELVLRRVNDELDARVRSQTAELEETNQALQSQLAQLESLYHKVPVGLCFLDPDLRFVRIDEKMAAINGASVADHIGRSVREIIPKRLADTVEALYKHVLETGESLSDVEIAGPSPTQGDDREWLVGCSRVETEHGSVVGLQVIVQDITDRKRAERALSRANEELAQFAYVAAHDLQEPLRTVVTFSQLVQHRCRNSLDVDSKANLDMVVSAAKRMSQLISDVLEYSRTTIEHDIVADEVDVGNVLASVLQSLRTRIEESRANVVVCGPLPVVTGDAVRLAQVFQNLVGNAIKYCRPGCQPHIDISAVRRDSNWVFTVKDNGQGFKPEYAERVFGAFKRLHGYEVPGSGVGLAICKAVVERHGGRIWAESEEGKGAAFHFTIPDRGSTRR